MIATVASSSSQYHHTINTLKYADRVRNPTIKAFELSCLQSIAVLNCCPAHHFIGPLSAAACTADPLGTLQSNCHAQSHKGNLLAAFLQQRS